MYICAQSLSCARLFATLQTVACQAPLSMRFSRQEYWSRLSFHTPEDLPDPGIKPASLTSPALADRFFTNYYIQPQIPILQRLAEKIKERTLPISCSALEVNRNQQKEKDKDRWINKLEEKND